jgi:predicted choloylglycine hydrolase
MDSIREGNSMVKRTARAIQVTTMVVLPVIVGFLCLTMREETGSLLHRNASSADDFDQAICRQDDLARAAPMSCTILTASQGDIALFANNEDYISPDTIYWTRPGSDQTYGAIYLGFDDFIQPQGGINEMGLAYDINGLPAMALNPHPELPSAPVKIGEYMLERAATVDEAIELLSGLSWGQSLRGQIHIADATGAAAVMSAGPDGELAFTRKDQGDGYLVSTNFNLAYPQNGTEFCWRYDTATRMLDRIFKRSILDVEQLRMILDAVHVEGPASNTVYSNIFDLRQGVIYLYHWHQFDEAVVLDVEESLTQGASSGRIRSLFSQETVDEAAAAYDHYLGIPDRWTNVAQIYLGITAVSLVVLLWLITRVSPMSWRMRLVWFLGGVFLGPIGLLVFLLSTHGVRGDLDAGGPTAPWQVALAGSVYSLVGYGGAWLLTLAGMILFIGDFTPRQLQGFMYSVPLLIGLLLFRVPLVSMRRKKGFWDALRRSMLPEFIALNFACAGFFPAAFLPVRLFFTETPGPGEPLFWFTLMMGVVAGFLTLIPLNMWISYRGATGEVRQLSSGGEPLGAAGDSLTLRNAWYLALASFALYLGTVYLALRKL